MALLDRASALPGLRLGRLQPFEESQIRQFLRNRLGSKRTATRRFNLIRAIRDLEGLSRTPRMLSFIAELPEAKLRATKDRSGAITAAKLYRTLIYYWLRFEYERSRSRGGPPTLSVVERRRVVTELAIRMWPKIERTVRVNDIAQVIQQSLSRLAERRFDTDAVVHLIGSGTLLVRDEEDVFTFVHQSVMEWLVANRSAVQLRAGQSPDALALNDLSSLMVSFFCDLAGEERARRWASTALSAPESTTEVATRNALLVLERVGDSPVEAIQLANQNLRGTD